MNRNRYLFCVSTLALVALGACSSGPSKPSRKAAIPLDKIQGKAQVLEEAGGATDAALNAGGPSIYIWQDKLRYRLFLRTRYEVVHGEEYVVEGIHAQKAIEDIGDPDQGKNGYPLQASCDRIVTMAWTKLAFDEVDPVSSLVRARVKRYPARPLFLVTKISPVAEPDQSASSADRKKLPAAEAKNIPEIDIAPEKQSAALIEGKTVQTAPLWEPKGGAVKCKVLIGTDGKISDLETGNQLCESVSWTEFRYQAPMQGGHPIKVRTEIEMHFEPRK